MVGIAELSGLMSSLKAAKDLTEAMIGLRDLAAMQTKVIEFQQTILDAQQRVLAVQEERTTMIEKVATLEKKIAGLEAWETEKQRYELKAVGYANSALVYRLKPDMAGVEAPHSLCANCYQDGQKSILQGDRAGADAFLVCPRCKTSIITQGHGLSRQSRR